MTPPTITYRTRNDLDLDAVIELYIASTLGQRRPVDDRQCMARMIAEANLVVTAWDGDLLVGISRSLTDFCYICYLADLAVRDTYQREGIGKELIRQTQAALGPNTRIILLAAPAADGYYPHIGFMHPPRAWMIGARDALADASQFC
jgi:predicted N-acetyltransferase YhbS